MTNKNRTACRHVIELHPGDEGEIELRFADQGAMFTVGLAAIDPAEGTAELLLDSMWGGYQMRRFIKDDRRWTTIWPADDGEVHATVDFGSGKHLNISSDTAWTHSLDLTDVAWNDGSLRLTFRETA
ncbi:MAG TPA: hypothetical protein VH477_06045 [Bryobacteraceae bacterium]|jgi:hypothetical protein